MNQEGQVVASSLLLDIESLVEAKISLATSAKSQATTRMSVLSSERTSPKRNLSEERRKG